MVEKRLIEKDEEIVCLLTGSGLKTPHIIQEYIPQPLIIKPSIAELMKML